MSRDVLYATRTPSPQHAIAASKAPQSFRPRNAPLLLVDVPVTVRVEHEQRGLEARRHQQVLQVLIAAVAKEFDHFFVVLHGIDDLSLIERSRVVLVDHLEDLAGRVQKF